MRQLNCIIDVVAEHTIAVVCGHCVSLLYIISTVFRHIMSQFLVCCNPVLFRRRFAVFRQLCHTDGLLPLEETPLATGHKTEQMTLRLVKWEEPGGQERWSSSIVQTQ
ncbi:hypothetical protein GDO81_021451 [Engystomops pustulosus]|uniref:Uncharacterized protein n=1 Tax=Engystomops pustulosus TaxID=76066 RepID=A0AAV6ZEW1_ENGPU|nr:hypothetical protein GDO81_021451 [Engystomops pustulosus]